METPRDWHESDDFWRLAEPVMFDENRLIMASAEIDAVIQLLRPAPMADFLDLCCGPGRHSLELARRGFRVTGVDRTALYLDRAKAKAEGLPAEFIRADAREFRRDEAYDFALNLYTSFGYFESPEDDALVASNLWASLRPGGALVLQTMGKEIVARRFVERDWVENGELVVLDERRLHAGFDAIENRWTLLHRSGRRDEIGFVVRLYAASEMKALLASVGFSSIRFFGSLNGTPYDHAAERMVVVAWK